MFKLWSKDRGVDCELQRVKLGSLANVSRPPDFKMDTFSGLSISGFDFEFSGRGLVSSSFVERVGYIWCDNFVAVDSSKLSSLSVCFWVRCSFIFTTTR